MDNASSTHTILDTLRTVEFRLGLKGYNVDEVDEYLEKAAIEAEQVQERLRTSNERLRHATERIAQLEVDLQRSPAERTVAPHPSAAPEAPPPATAPAAHGGAVTEDTLQRTLVLAQKFVDQTKRESEAEAAQVVSRAEERARALFAEAEERARQLTSETEERMRDEVARLEQARARLGSEVETMSRYLEEQRTKVRASLVEALHWVEERMQPPARSAGERAPDGGASAQAADHKLPGEGAGSTASAEPSGSRSAGAGGSAGQAGAGAASTVGGGTGAGRPEVAPPPSSAHERQPVATVPSHPSSSVAPAADRTQPAGVRLGVLNGGLFEAGQDESNGSEGNRLGE